MLVFSAASLGVVKLEKHVPLVLVLLCVQVDVVSPAELLVVEALDYVVVNQLNDLLCEQEPYALNVDQVLHVQYVTCLLCIL